MSGTIPLSLTQQFDIYGKPLSGGQLFLIQAGTVATPQNGFQDTGLTIPLPNPIALDAAGRIPQFFLADGLIKVRLTDKSGVLQLAAESILVIGPSTGGGGGGGIDPTTIMQPGFLAPYYGTGARTGFVRANGRTIGSATSGATERAFADCQALFEYLWNADPNLVVSTGRGVSSSADWSASKTIALPDWRGRALAALDDMGNVAAGRLTAAYFGAVATTLGAAGGSQSKALIRSDLPNVAPIFTGASSALAITSTFTAKASQATINTIIGGTGNLAGGGFLAEGIQGTVTSTGSVVPLGTIQDINGAVAQTAFSAVPPLMLATIYIKL